MPVGSGGVCGGDSSAYQILKLISLRAKCGDALMLIGDFNMGPGSATITRLQQRLQIAYSGKSMGQQVDYVFWNLPQSAMLDAKDLGSFGSDHDALSVTFRMGTGPLPVIGTSTTAPAAPVVPGQCVGKGHDPLASGAEQKCCSGLKKCLRRDRGWSFRCQPCADQCPDEPHHDFAARPCEEDTAPPQPPAALVSYSNTVPPQAPAALSGYGSSTGFGQCVEEDKDPLSSGQEQPCCPGLKKCLREDRGWQYRCHPCVKACNGDKTFTSRMCERLITNSVFT